ncbi:MAG: 3-deoxy-8-phosphooctulonate synthase [Desulfobacterales bacterium]|nr:MAG: 3-deoxy-8-phosphooctulonate synthase [Desulfobacterales bacterium]
MSHLIKTGNIVIGQGLPLVLISGPCVIENYETTREIAASLKEITARLEIPFIFKASYDKANRTSVKSFRGPGLADGLNVLAEIKKEFDVPVLSDVHRISEIEPAARVLDIIQIPAFLCRQTDVITAVAQTGKPVNIKKGQFLAPWDISNVVEKITSTGNDRILITERGTMFGYNNLVVDFRGFMIMRRTGYPVIFDATHSVQLPGGAGTRSGGQRDFAPMLARAAVAAGVDGIFMEVHGNPDQALCDGPNSLKLDTVYDLLAQLKSIHRIINRNQGSDAPA